MALSVAPDARPKLGEGGGGGGGASSGVRGGGPGREMGGGSRSRIRFRSYCTFATKDSQGLQAGGEQWHCNLPS